MFKPIKESRTVPARSGATLTLQRRQGAAVRLLIEDAEGRPQTFADLLGADVPRLIAALEKVHSENQTLEVQPGSAPHHNFRYYNRQGEQNAQR